MRSRGCAIGVMAIAALAVSGCDQSAPTDAPGSASPFDTATTPVDQVIDRILAAWDQNPSYEARMVTQIINMSTGQAQFSGEDSGSLRVRHDADNTYFHEESRSTLTFHTGGQGTQMKQRRLVIGDGEFVYMVQGSGRVWTGAIKRGLDHSGSADVRRMLANLSAKQDLRVLPNAEVNGVEAYVIEATPRSTAQNPVAKTLYYYHKQRGVTLRSAAIGHDGQELKVTEYLDIKFDVDFPPGTFVFQPPPGVKVQDMTETAQP